MDFLNALSDNIFFVLLCFFGGMALLIYSNRKKEQKKTENKQKINEIEQKKTEEIRHLEEIRLKLDEQEKIDRENRIRQKQLELQREIEQRQKEKNESNRYIPSSVRREVWRRDQGKCVNCGSKIKLEFDHIIPVSTGGSNTARNIELLCEECNRQKSNKIE